MRRIYKTPFDRLNHYVNIAIIVLAIVFLPITIAVLAMYFFFRSAI